ncbi:acyl carrier protein [Actinacidiphila alni]|uniref:acyl carrier protein n=1 Tax=Actinacidiphila alni TaxID=380248 RepID=UPI0033E145CF
MEQTVPLHLRGLPDPDVLRAAGIDVRTRIIERYICRQLEPYLHVPPAHRISTDRSLRSQGVDSITALALRRRLVTALGVDVPAADLLRDDSVTEVAALLAALVLPARDVPAARPAPAVPDTSPASVPAARTAPAAETGRDTPTERPRLTAAARAVR